MHVIMDFDAKNPFHRKQLFPVLRKLAESDPAKGPLDFIDEALEQPLVRGKDYLNNVRKGQFAAPIAAQLHSWLDQNHFTLAHQTSPDIFPELPAKRWTKIVSEEAIKGELAIAVHQDRFGVLEKASKLSSGDVTIRLGEFFYFEMRAGTSGYVTLFQHVGLEWNPLELNEDDAMSLALSEGQNRFPILANGQVDPLRESRDEGPQEFVAIVSKADNIPLTPERLLSWYPASGCELHSITVNFTK